MSLNSVTMSVTIGRRLAKSLLKSYDNFGRTAGRPAQQEVQMRPQVIKQALALLHICPIWTYLDLRARDCLLVLATTLPPAIVWV